MKYQNYHQSKRATSVNSESAYNTLFTVAQRNACKINVKQANKTDETFRGNLICIVKHSPFPADLTTHIILLSSTTCATALPKQALCS